MSSRLFFHTLQCSYPDLLCGLWEFPGYHFRILEPKAVLNERVHNKILGSAPCLQHLWTIGSLRNLGLFISLNSLSFHCQSLHLLCPQVPFAHFTNFIAVAIASYPLLYTVYPLRVHAPWVGTNTYSVLRTCYRLWICVAFDWAWIPRHRLCSPTMRAKNQLLTRLHSPLSASAQSFLRPQHTVFLPQHGPSSSWAAHTTRHIEFKLAPSFEYAHTQTHADKKA